MIVAICDDDIVQLKIIQGYLKEYVKAHKGKCEIHNYDNGQKLVMDATRINFDIVFLDILMDGISGIDVAKKLNDLIDVNIIFTTGSVDFAIEAFSLKAVHYLVKPITYKEFEEAMDRCEISSNGEKKVNIKTTSGYVVLDMNEIAYIEASGKNSIIHCTDDEEYEARMSFTELSLDILDESFAQCHRSFIVNTKLVKEIINNEILLTNNLSVPIGRVYKKDFMNTL